MHHPLPLNHKYRVPGADINAQQTWRADPLSNASPVLAPHLHERQVRRRFRSRGRRSRLVAFRQLWGRRLKYPLSDELRGPTLVSPH